MINRPLFKKILLILLVIQLILLASCGNNPTRTAESVASHDVYFDIEFEQNWLLATYNVEVYLDNERIGLIPHGKHFTELVNVAEGSHTLKFCKESDHSVNRSLKFTLKEDSTYFCTIHSNKSNIEAKGYELVPGIQGHELTVVDVTGKTIREAVADLKDIGFINIDYNSDIWDMSAWVVTEQSVSAGAITDKNEKILLTCERIKKTDNSEIADNDNTKTSDEPISNVDTSKPGVIEPDILTIDNCEDLAQVLKSEYVDIDKQKAFVEKYHGKTIEFDCVLLDLIKSEKYKTMWSYVLVPGEDSESVYASFFFIENVNPPMMHWEKENRPDSITKGSKIRIRARVLFAYDMYIYIEPICTWGR